MRFISTPETAGVWIMISSSLPCVVTPFPILAFTLLASARSKVFNRGSATPRGSVEVLQGDRQMISSEAFFSLFQKLKTSKRLHKHKQNVKIAFYSLKIIHRLPMSLHAII